MVELTREHQVLHVLALRVPAQCSNQGQDLLRVDPLVMVLVKQVESVHDLVIVLDRELLVIVIVVDGHCKNLKNSNRINKSVYY